MNLPFEKRTQKVLLKKYSATNPKYGKNPEERSTERLLRTGIVVLDKPSGPTSHMAADYVKRVLSAEKAGHSGTLDPVVTGVLPVALQESTRVTSALLNAGKEYMCLMHLHSDITDEQLAKVIDEFTGKIDQLPPKKSAVKRQLRQRSIYYMDILERQGRDVLFRVGCEAGTYIRKLVHDIGVKVGSGAHMAELRRTKAGPFHEDKSVTLQNLADAFHYYKNGDDAQLRGMILPLESAVSHMKKIWVHDDTINSLCHGSLLKMPGISKLDSDIERHDRVAVMSLKGELVLIGESMLDSRDIVNLDRGIAVKTMQVFMKPETYPRTSS